MTQFVNIHIAHCKDKIIHAAAGVFLGYFWWVLLTVCLFLAYFTVYFRIKMKVDQIIFTKNILVGLQKYLQKHNSMLSKIPPVGSQQVGWCTKLVWNFHILGCCHLCFQKIARKIVWFHHGGRNIESYIVSRCFIIFLVEIVKFRGLPRILRLDYRIHMIELSEDNWRFFKISAEVLLS